jgi:hypothetical protein
MPRLNQSAFQVLNAELQRLCEGKPLEQVRRSLVLKRLEKLRQQEGAPATYAEIKDAIDDIFPEFDDRVIRKAASLNQPNPFSSILQWTVGLGVGAATLAGTVWVLNLPYPMIRWPVAKTAPIVLLPSFISMDHHYRQSIIYIEQADQLINNATSAADFDLGAAKAEQAQKHLDHLPVWFLGYYPQRYCSWFSCGWQFTLDEFENARALIGRMDAQIFQEKNAFTTLDESTLAVETARRRYEAVQTSEEKLAILASWQENMDKLAEIPPETLAGKTAQTRLQAFQRDYQTLTGTTASAKQSNTFVKVAKSYATKAVDLVQNPPKPETAWAQAADLWKIAIDELEKVPEASPGYEEAQALKAEYTANLGNVRNRQQLEQQASTALNGVRTQITVLLEETRQDPNTNVLPELQRLIDQLNQVEPGTTAYSEAQQLLEQANRRFNQIQAAIQEQAR